VGARTRDILGQFLSEAIALSLIGGVLGILLGVGVSRALAGGLGWPTAVTLGSILVAFAFAAAVGVFFGYYPASKAAQLDPIDALRYE
jgi:putative ABC transport system permease protein